MRLRMTWMIAFSRLDRFGMAIGCMEPLLLTTEAVVAMMHYLQAEKQKLCLHHSQLRLALCCYERDG